MRDWVRDDEASGYGVVDSGRVLIRGGWSGTAPGRVETRDGDLVLTHEMPEGWIGQDGWLTDNRAVFLDVQPDEHVARVALYDLTTVPAREIDIGFPSDLSPVLDIWGELLVYIDGSPETGMCLRSLDLISGTRQELDCHPPGTILDDVSVHESVVLYTTLVDWNRPSKRCKTLKVIDHAGHHDRMTEQLIAEHARCIAWSGVATEAGVAWDEVDPAHGQIGLARAFFASSTGTVTDIGRIQTDSIIACGSVLYWTGENDQESTSVYRWIPGTESAVLSLNQERNAAVTALQCGDDEYVTTRLDDISGVDEHVRLMTTRSSQ